MQIVESDHNRTFTIKDVPGYGDLEITIAYTGNSNALKAVALDGEVIPMIKSRLRNVPAKA